MQIITERLLIRPVVATDWPAVREIWALLAPLPMAQYDKPHNTDPDNVRARVTRWADFTASDTEHIFFAVCLDGPLPLAFTLSLNTTAIHVAVLD